MHGARAAGRRTSFQLARSTPEHAVHGASATGRKRLVSINVGHPAADAFIGVDVGKDIRSQRPSVKPTVAAASPRRQHR